MEQINRKPQTLEIAVQQRLFGLVRFFDRFYLRQNILGIVKALSGGGLGIWYLMDMAIQLVESWMRRDHTLARSGIKFVEQDINISYYLASINSIILLLMVIAIPTIIIIAIQCRCDSNDKKTY